MRKKVKTNRRKPPGKIERTSGSREREVTRKQKGNIRVEQSREKKSKHQKQK